MYATEIGTPAEKVYIDTPVSSSIGTNHEKKVFLKGGATFIWKRKALTPKGTKAFLHFQNSRLTDSTRSISFIDSLSATTKSKLTDFTSSIESILNEEKEKINPLRPDFAG